MPEKKSTSADRASVADKGPGGSDLGRASYRAEQTPDAVIIFAFGWHSTPGYINFFEQSPIDIYPPEFIFRSIPPGGMMPQVITPFATWVVFGATEPIKTVSVHDADGPHEVSVEQMPKHLAAAKRGTWVSGNVVRGGGVGSRASTLGIGEEEPGTTVAFGEEDFRAPTTMATGEEGPDPITTMATGEEQTRLATTLAVGEEQPPITTLAVGEEGRATFRMTTLAIGEEDPTTLAVGEEGPTTLAVGEEDPTTQAIGEEGPTTLAVGEETGPALRNSPFGTF